MAPNDPPATPRQLASSHNLWPTMTPRFDRRAERRQRARRSLPTTPAASSGSAFTLKTGSVLSLGSIPAQFPDLCVGDLAAFSHVATPFAKKLPVYGIIAAALCSDVQ
jgi:hypothetical protein